MRVCLVSREYPPETGGIGTQTFLKAHALTDLGHAVHVVTAASDANAGLSLDAEVVLHRVADPSSELPFSESSVQWIAYSQTVAATLYELNEQERFDVIEFAEYGAEGFVYELDTSEYRDVPVAVMLHGSLAMFAQRGGWPAPGTPLHRFGTFMEETVVRGADLLLAASRNIADFWVERGIPRERIHVVHTAVDPAAFVPSDARGDGQLDVLFVGRIDGEKGIFDVVDALGELAPRYPTLRCRIVGSGQAADEQHLRELIEASGAATQFEVVGPVPHDRLPLYYAGCDVFAAPAPHDHGVATVYLEAMACGKPVIASTAGGAPEAVLDRETGLLVPPDDPHALVGALDELLGDDALRHDLGRKGRQRVVEHFSATRLAERSLAAYEQAAGTRESVESEA